MKKRIGVIAVLIMCVSVGLAYAVVTVSYDVPDAKYAKFLAAFVAQSDAHVVITITGSQGAGDPNQEDYSAQIDFRTPVAIDPNTATNPEIKAFVKDRVALIASAFKCAHEEKNKDDSDKAYIAAMPVIDVNEPDANDMM